MSKILFKVNVSTVIAKDGKFLVVKRADDEDVLPGMWGIPGGTVEPTDGTLEFALARKCEEEVGVKIGNSVLINTQVLDNGDRGSIYLTYKSEYVSGEPKALDGTAEVHWLSIEEIRPLPLTPNTLDMIEQCYNSTNG
jgi:ADP-ribose pyrophosphatase YjhB (NUDIX family)